MPSKVSRLFCVCYLDGRTSEMGYRFTISAGYGIGYTAYRTGKGLRYFMDNYGLTVDKSTVQMHDLRASGLGRLITFSFMPKDIYCVYFWNQDEVPVDAKPFIGLVNGSYVTLYALDSGDSVRIFKPNPNAKEVYKIQDYHDSRVLYG